MLRVWLLAAMLVVTGCSVNETKDKAAAGNAGASTGDKSGDQSNNSNKDGKGSDESSDGGDSSSNSDTSGSSKSSNKVSGSKPSTGNKSLAINEMTPPQNADEMADWIEEGFYLDWACEEAPHAARPQSPHGKNRICSNELLSKNEKDVYPVGAAGIKEIYTGNDITGYAVFLKVAAGEGGDKWYWYEILGSNVVADGLGNSGAPKNTCVSCHVKAAKDQVFTQVLLP